MQNPLLQAFPEPTDLLEASPEELSAVLIKIFPEVAQFSGVNFGTIERMFFPTTGTGYPSASRDAVGLVIAEALSWMEHQGIFVRNPKQPYSYWYVLTRKGTALSNN